MSRISDDAYDLVVLGGGAAAFAAITEADRRGLTTAIVNDGLPLGGTCVNVGCVPSKHLLAVAESAFEAPRNPFDSVAYTAGEPAFDWVAAVDEKDALVAQLRRENYVTVAEHFETDVYEGHGQFVDGTTIEVDSGADEGAQLVAERVLVATGSSPWAAPIDGLESVDYETSESILTRHELPESVIVLGGGYVALEWGQILHRLGVDVTLLQRSNRLLSGMEGQLGREIARCFEEEGIEVVTGNDVRRVRSVKDVTGGDPVIVETEVDGEARTFEAEDLFVATGVRPNTTGIGLERIGVEVDGTGAVIVDEYYGTSNPNVYAAGDCIGEPMLETVAAKEGNHAIRNVFGDAGVTVDYDSVPEVVFTSPEIAAVGITEREYMDQHGTCSCRTVELAELPKAQAVGEDLGLLQVVKHHETDEVVGVHMVTPRAADMVSEATLAVQFGLTVDDVIDTIHPFPTFSEAFKRACQAFRRDTSTMSCCVE